MRLGRPTVLRSCKSAVLWRHLGLAGPAPAPAADQRAVLVHELGPGQDASVPGRLRQAGAYGPRAGPRRAPGGRADRPGDRPRRASTVIRGAEPSHRCEPPSSPRRKAGSRGQVPPCERRGFLTVSTERPLQHESSGDTDYGSDLPRRAAQGTRASAYGRLLTLARGARLAPRTPVQVHHDGAPIRPRQLMRARIS